MSLELKLREFLGAYGDRACIVLKAIYEEYKAGSGLKLGDFSVRGVKSRLKNWGLEYNPVPLLVKLEKEVGVIETTYRSTTQRWWRIVNVELLERILEECGGMRSGDLEDPKVKLLRAQLRILRPRVLLENLKKLKSRGKLTRGDVEFVKRIAFNELPLMLRIKEEIENLGYDDVLREELDVVEELVSIVEELSEVIEARGHESFYGYKSREYIMGVDVKGDT